MSKVISSCTKSLQPPFEGKIDFFFFFFIHQDFLWVVERLMEANAKMSFHLIQPSLSFFFFFPTGEEAVDAGVG